VGTGAERAENLASGSGAISGCKNNYWSDSGAGTKGCGAENGAENETHRNRFERGSEKMPLLLHSQALFVAERVERSRSGVKLKTTTGQRKKT